MRLAGAAFVTVVLVPMIKYPATPPAVGNPDTIERRTALYLAMIAISLAAAILATRLGRSLTARLGAWNAAIVGCVLFAVVVGVAQLLLPSINETGDFPGDVLWRFRLASVGTRLVLLAVLGLAFGALVERGLQRPESGASATT